MIHATETTPNYQFGINANQSRPPAQGVVDGASYCFSTLFSIFRTIAMLPYKTIEVETRILWNWSPQAIKDCIVKSTKAFSDMFDTIKDHGQLWYYRDELRQAIDVIKFGTNVQEIINTKISGWPPSQQRKFFAELTAELKKAEGVVAKATANLLDEHLAKSNEIGDVASRSPSKSRHDAKGKGVDRADFRDLKQQAPAANGLLNIAALPVPLHPIRRLPAEPPLSPGCISLSREEFDKRIAECADAQQDLHSHKAAHDGKGRIT